MPTYTMHDNHITVVAETVASIQDAREPGSEYIVIDDGSRDFDTISDIAAEYTVDFFVRHLKNSGIAKSWNTGLRLARGEYVVIVNDDITVERGWLDKLRVALEQEDEYMVAAPGVAGKQNGTGIEEDYQWFPGYCFMLKRSTIENIGFFDEQFSPFNFEDTDYWTRVLAAGGKLVRNYSTTITHREGHVLHTLDYDGVSKANKEKFLQKWGFDPIPVFYENQEFDFSSLILYA